jgi:micrococcal nuclease
VEIEGGARVRLLGVDTPETVDPKRPVGCYGKEASDETKHLLTGQTVILQKDVSETDKYQRLLRFIFLPQPDGSYLFVDDFLVREGFAKVLTIPPDVKYKDQFLEAQTAARMAKKGLWGHC